MRAANIGRKPVMVFSLPSHPPGVKIAATLAMDSQPGITQAAAWGNGIVGSLGWEGQTFLGYAFLSELAQRPEYRVISETLAKQMTREWIRFTSKSGDDKSKTKKIDELKDEFKRLGVQEAFARAVTQDGWFGRGHIYIDTGDGDDPDELQKPIGDGWDEKTLAKMARKPIKALRTVEAVWCYPTGYNSFDPLQREWYRPESWFVQAKIVHESRLMTFIGREVPDLLKPTYSFGGISLSQLCMPYVNNWLETRQGVNQAVNAYSTFNFQTDLSSMMNQDGQEMANRAAFFAMVRRNAGLFVTNKATEEFKNVSAPLGTLDALQAQAQEHMCSVSHIPAVILLGIDPVGLNATSEGTLQAFYAYIKSCQEDQLRPNLHRVLGLIMTSLWGKPDEDIDFEFEPLYAMTEKELGEVEKLKAETDVMLIDSGVLHAEESRARIAADPDSEYGNIKVEDVPDLLEEEEQGLEPEGGRPDPDATNKGAAKPKPAKAKVQQKEAA